MSISQKQELRNRRKHRIRSKVTGTASRPRLSVYKSNVALYVQMIDDAEGKTLLSVSSVKDKKKNMDVAKKIGADLAELAKKKEITSCVFDRNGYKYHGVVKALADSAREGGLSF